MEISIVGLRFENYIVNYSGQSLDQEIFDDAELINVNDFFPSLNIIRSLR